MNKIHDLIREYTQINNDDGIDVFFFRVRLRRELIEEEIEELKQLITDYQGDFSDINPLDGKEHSYLQVGGWIGDQQLALRLMGLGALLDFWSVMQPNLLPLSPDMRKQMAGQGYISIMPLKVKN